MTLGDLIFALCQVDTSGRSVRSPSRCEWLALKRKRHARRKVCICVCGYVGGRTFKCVDCACRYTGKCKCSSSACRPRPLAAHKRFERPPYTSLISCFSHLIAPTNSSYTTSYLRLPHHLNYALTPPVVICITIYCMRTRRP